MRIRLVLTVLVDKVQLLQVHHLPLLHQHQVLHLLHHLLWEEHHLLHHHLLQELHHHLLHLV